MSAIWNDEIARQLALFMLIWLKTFSCVSDLPSFQETRFDNVRQLNFKCIGRGTFEIKLIVAMVMDDVNDKYQNIVVWYRCRHMHLPTKRFDITLKYHSYEFWTDFKMWDGLLKNISKWNLNIELVSGLLKMQKQRDYEVIPLGHIIYRVLVNKISEISNILKNTHVSYFLTEGGWYKSKTTWNKVVMYF